MKRFIAVLLLVVMLCSLLVACGKTTQCEICGQTKSCKQIEVYGAKGWVCKDCEKLVKGVSSALGGLLG